MRVSFERLARVLVWIVLGVAAFVQPVANDTWWHLRAGREIWHQHSIPLTETWSWTAHGRPWPNHEWLWQAITWPLYDVSSVLLSLLAGVLALVPLVLLRPRDLSLTSTAVLAGVGVPLCLAWSIRPQLLGMACFAVLLVLVQRRQWWAVPLVMLVWANAHAGVAVGGALLVLLTLESLVRRRPERLPLVVVTALSAVATVLQPLGFGLWTYVLEVPGRSRTTGIQEWAPAWELTRAGVLVLGLVAVVLGVLVARRARLRGWPVTVEVVAVVLLVPLSLTGARNGSLLALAALPLLTAALRPENARIRGEVPAGSVLAGALGLVAALLVGLVWSRPEVQGWKPLSPGFVTAVDACPGRLYNTYGSGGPVLFWTRTPVFVDSRQDPYPAQVLEDAVEIADDVPAGLLDRYAIRCAVVDAGAAPARLRARGWTVRSRSGGWVLLERP